MSAFFFHPTTGSANEQWVLLQANRWREMGDGAIKKSLTYLVMSTRPQSRALDSVVVPAIPFLEGSGSVRAIFFVPLEHLRLEVNACLLAVEADGLFGVI